MAPPPSRRVETPQVRCPPVPQVRRDFLLELLHEPCTGYRDGSSRFYQSRDVTQIERVSAIVRKRIDRHDRVEEVCLERQLAGISVNRCDAVLYPRVADALRVVISAKP